MTRNIPAKNANQSIVIFANDESNTKHVALKATTMAVNNNNDMISFLFMSKNYHKINTNAN